MQLVLASTSPQRRAILRQLGIPFTVHAPAYVEEALPISAAELVERHAAGKAAAASAVVVDRPVLGVDTAVVTSSGAVLGKPATSEEASAMLASLAGTRHSVLSGLALVGATGSYVGHAVTDVSFRQLDPATIAAYVACGEWRGRAGAYAIQGVGAALVERVEGCYSNVVGLPVALLIEAFHALGIPFLPAGDRSSSA